MEGRVRWFFGLARKLSGYSTPIAGTPCDVPEPRKMKEKDMARLDERWCSAPKRPRFVHPDFQQCHSFDERFLLPNRSTTSKFEAKKFCRADHIAHQESRARRGPDAGIAARAERDHWRNR